jgi:hypothetical protein
MPLANNINDREMEKFIENAGVLGVNVVFVSSAGYTAARAAARDISYLEFNKFVLDDAGTASIRVIET